MSLQEWLDIGRNLLLSGVLGAAVVGVFRLGRASHKLDTVVEETKGVKIEVHAMRDDFGNRLTAVESKVETSCRAMGKE